MLEKGFLASTWHGAAAHFESVLLLLYYNLFLDLISFDCGFFFFLLEPKHIIENVTATVLALLGVGVCGVVALGSLSLST